MKIISRLLTVAVFFCLACKKERTCNCTVTRSGSVTTDSRSAGFPPLVPPIDSSSVEQYLYRTSYVENYDKVSKRDLRASCPSRTEEMIFEQSRNDLAGFFSVTITDSGSVVKECSIQ